MGVTLPTEKLPEFERRLCEYMDGLPEGAFHPLITIDACVNLDELTLRNVAQLDALAPFGQEHPVPVYLARDVTLLHSRAVGAERNHFSCSLSNGRTTVAGIMFHCNDIEALMKTDSVVNAAFEVQIDEWKNRRSVKAMLKSLSPARTCVALEACLNPENLSFVSDLYADARRGAVRRRAARPRGHRGIRERAGGQPRPLGDHGAPGPAAPARAHRARHHRRRPASPGPTRHLG